MKKILVVVDMQNDFIDGPLGTPEARAIVDNVCAKIRESEWDYIYTTQDTHESTDYLETQEGKKLPIEHCIDCSTGWLLNKKVFTALEEKYNKWSDLQKRTFGCSELVQFIGEDFIYRVEYTDADIELTLVGVCTDICVISNALLLKAHYPEMKIVVDASCCAGSTPKLHKEALHVMKSCQIDIINERLYRPVGWTDETEKLFVEDKESED